jgi:hypothetical protein
MAIRERKTVYLDSDLSDQISRLAKRKGGRRLGSTFSEEANRLLRRSLLQDEARDLDVKIAPLIQEILDTRLSQIDRHLASMIAKAGVDAATCMLICTRLLTGDSVPPEDLENVYESIRHMAIDHFKAKEAGLPPVRDAADTR